MQGAEALLGTLKHKIYVYERKLDPQRETKGAKNGNVAWVHIVIHMV